MLYSLAQNPEWQTKCQQELDDILDGRDSDDILWYVIMLWEHVIYDILDGRDSDDLLWYVIMLWEHVIYDILDGRDSDDILWYVIMLWEHAIYINVSFYGKSGTGKWKFGVKCGK